MHLSQPVTASLPFLCRSCVACFTALSVHSTRRQPHLRFPGNDEKRPGRPPAGGILQALPCVRKFPPTSQCSRILVVGAALGQKAKIRAASATPLRRRAGREGQPCLITRTRREKKATPAKKNVFAGRQCRWELPLVESPRTSRLGDGVRLFFAVMHMHEVVMHDRARSLPLSRPHALLRNRRMQML